MKFNLWRAACAAADVGAAAVARAAAIVTVTRGAAAGEVESVAAALVQMADVAADSEAAA